MHNRRDQYDTGREHENMRKTIMRTKNVYQEHTEIIEFINNKQCIISNELKVTRMCVWKVINNI